MSEVAFWIHGQPPRKSNGRRVVAANGKPRVIKSEAALRWVEDAIKQVPIAARLNLGSLEKPVAMVLDIYYTSRRPDLSGELVMDMLEIAGVITNDRYVYDLELHKRFSKERPGVGVRVRVT